MTGTLISPTITRIERPATHDAALETPVVRSRAGDTWGFGRAWKRLTIVRRMRWLV